MKKSWIYFVAVLVFGSVGFSLNAADTSISHHEKNKDPIKHAAFNVLDTKCNGCHKIQKQNYIFTLDNMDKFASVIYKQVFVKKKMPKGDGNELSTDESVALKKWLDATL